MPVGLGWMPSIAPPIRSRRISAPGNASPMMPSPSAGATSASCRGSSRATPIRIGRAGRCSADCMKGASPPPPPPQIDLPFWEGIPVAKRCPVLDLLDGAGVPVMAQGRGAPLVQRFIVRMMASVAPDDRRFGSVRMVLTVRELKDGLWPRGWQRGRDWPKLRDMLLHVHNYSIVYPGRTGESRRLFAVTIADMPDYDHPRLKDHVVSVVNFPASPESKSGPPISLSDLDALSLDSAPRYRSFVAGNSLPWQPGVTRVRAPRAGNRWVWTHDHTRYPVLTSADRRRLAFGPHDAKNRTHADVDAAWRDPPGLVVVAERAVDPVTGAVGWIVVPKDAAAVIRCSGPT